MKQNELIDGIKRFETLPLKPLTKIRGWIQDLSEGSARVISEQKNPDLGTKRRGTDKYFLR